MLLLSVGGSDQKNSGPGGSGAGLDARGVAPAGAGGRVTGGEGAAGIWARSCVGRDAARVSWCLDSRAWVVRAACGARRVRRERAARRRELSVLTGRTARSVVGAFGGRLRRRSDGRGTDGSSAGGRSPGIAAPRCGRGDGGVGLSAMPRAITTASAVRPIAVVRRDRCQVSLGRRKGSPRGEEANAEGAMERAACSPSPAVGQGGAGACSGTASGSGQSPKQWGSLATGSRADRPPVQVVAMRSAIGSSAESFVPAVGIWAMTCPDPLLGATSSWWQTASSPCARTCALAIEPSTPTSSGAVIHDGRVGVAVSLTPVNPLSGRREQTNFAAAAHAHAVRA